MTNENVHPAKCKQCNKPTSSVLVCDYCHTLNPAAATVTDYFTLLGLPRRYDIDLQELHRRFVALSRHAHPDFHGGESPEVQGLSLQISAALNDAYRALSDPATRAAYLLELLGGKSSAQDKSVPDGFLNTMMMLQEEMADARSGGDQDELGRIRTVLITQRDGLLRRIAKLFEDYQEAVACQAVTTDILNEARKQLNAVSYVRKLLSQL